MPRYGGQSIQCTLVIYACVERLEGGAVSGNMAPRMESITTIISYIRGQFVILHGSGFGNPSEGDQRHKKRDELGVISHYRPRS